MTKIETGSLSPFRVVRGTSDEQILTDSVGSINRYDYASIGNSESFGTIKVLDTDGNNE